MTKIAFNKKGSGPSVILLHGFPMNSDVWNEFSNSLSQRYTVYTPDLPGFGSSPLPPLPATLSSVAEILNDWVNSQGIPDSALVGHSMGGYVALEMIRQAKGTFSGLCLFHSTALPDSDEKKESRSKVVQFIESNGVLAFTSNFIQPLFASENHTAIPAVKDITVRAEAEAVKAYTVAMRDRADNTGVLKDFGKPVLLLGGDKDKGITVESLKQQDALSDQVSLHILEDTAHMGMFEKPEECQRVLAGFLAKVFA